MEFISVPVSKSDSVHVLTFSLDNLVSFYDDKGATRLNFRGGEYAWTCKPVAKELKRIIRMKGHIITEIVGE